MTHPHAVAILLGVSVVITLLSAVGLLAMRDPYQRVHYIGPVASISAACIAAAVLLTEGLNQAGIKAIVSAGLLLLMNAVLSHATARAARIRQFGDWRPQPGERVHEVKRGDTEEA